MAIVTSELGRVVPCRRDSSNDVHQAMAESRTVQRRLTGIVSFLIHSFIHLLCPRRVDIKRLCASDVCRLTSACLTVAYIGPKSRTERTRKTKIGSEIAYITRDSDTTFKVKRLKVKVTCEAGAHCGGLPTQLVYIRHLGPYRKEKHTLMYIKLRQ